MSRVSQITSRTVTHSPGLQPSQICENLDNAQAAKLLPTGAFKLIDTIDPNLLSGPKRTEVLGKILSLELAVDDSQRREILLGAVPTSKIGELEDRIGISIDQLRQKDKLEQPLSRAVLGFFGLAAIDDRAPRCFRAT